MVVDHEKQEEYKIMIINSKCKICRRAGIKLFLRGERCLSQKCPMIRKPYPPGPKTKKRRKNLSEYGKELREKQKLKNWYNLDEKQFRMYVAKAMEAQRKGKEVGTTLIQILESRLDNIVFRLGFAPSRSGARQMVSHGHFEVNGRLTNIPSYLVKKGDKIKVKETSQKKTIFQKVLPQLLQHHLPSWLRLDSKKLEGEVIDLANLEEVAPPVELSSIFEFYSK